MLDEHTARVMRDPDFLVLSRQRGAFAWTLTAIMLVVYFGFIFLVAFAPEIASRPVGGGITLGLVLGLGVIVSAIVLTGVYVTRANGPFDRLTQRIVGAAR